MCRHSKERTARHRVLGNVICCSKCELPGGTMVKDDKGGYMHDPKDERCKLIQTKKLLTNVAQA